LREREEEKKKRDAYEKSEKIIQILLATIQDNVDVLLINKLIIIISEHNNL